MSAGTESKVLIAMDGSEHSLFAFDWYIDTVHKPGNEVIIAHCPDYSALTHAPILTSDPSMVAQMIKNEQHQIEIIVNKIKEKITGSGIKGRILRLSGEVGHAIVKTANMEKVDVIITGTRGQGKMRRTLMGSVSDYILHHSHVPVMVIRKPVDLEEATEEKESPPVTAVEVK